MSYFAEPYFITYDEWFDDDLETTKVSLKNKKTENISTIHEFFYRQSIHKIGASENHMQKNINLKSRKINNNYEDYQDYYFIP